MHTDAKLADRWKISAKQWEADLIRGMVRWSRKLRRRAKHCCNRAVPVTDMDMELDDENVRRYGLVDAAMHACMQGAKRCRHIDLFRYFENLYETQPNSDSLFMGIDELCMLTKKEPCPRTGHTTCLAHHFMEAYNNLKVTRVWAHAGG